MPSKTQPEANQPGYDREHIVELYPLYEAALTFVNRYEDAWNYATRTSPKPAKPRTHILVRGKKVALPSDEKIANGLIQFIQKQRLPRPGMNKKS